MRGMTRALACATAAAVVAAGMIAAPAAQAADAIVVWADPVHAPVIQQLTANGYKGTPVTVVTKDPATVRADLAVVGAADAPDVLWGDLAWTGELASAETIVPVKLTKKLRAKFRPNVLVGSNVGGERYGVPVQISNLALITNTKLVPQQPTTFAALSDLALKLKKDKTIRVPFALPQSEGTSPWSTYPLFSGVGGYLFGRGQGGALDPQDVGLASKKLRKNSDLIDGWNASGLIDSTLTAERARKVFANAKSPFFLAGPEDLAYLLALDFPYRIGTVPPVKAGIKAVPLLTVHGFMLTRFAEKHGVGEQAAKLRGQAHGPASRAAGPRQRVQLVPGQHRCGGDGADRRWAHPGDRQRGSGRGHHAEPAAGRSPLGPLCDRVDRDDERAGRHAGQAGLPARGAGGHGDDRAGVAGLHSQ